MRRIYHFKQERGAVLRLIKLKILRYLLKWYRSRLISSSNITSEYRAHMISRANTILEGVEDQIDNQAYKIRGLG